METKLNSIEIKGSDNNIAGTTEWLKREIEHSIFYYSSTKEDEPCICWKIVKEKDGKPTTIFNKIVAFITKSEGDYYGWNEYKNSYITNSMDSGFDTPYIFRYLDNQSKKYCDDLIKKLADKLINKLNNDKQIITVIVE